MADLEKAREDIVVAQEQINEAQSHLRIAMEIKENLVIAQKHVDLAQGFLDGAGFTLQDATDQLDGYVPSP